MVNRRPYSTDSSEKGRVMWARVKGRTENALMRLGFQKVYNFRPGFMRPTPGQRMSDVGLMINSVLKGYPKQVLEINDINSLARA